MKYMYSTRFIAMAIVALGIFGACSREEESTPEANWVDPCGVTKAPTKSQPARQTPVKEGRCLWLEHKNREKYLNVCVNRILDDEAELVTEWRLYKRIEREGKTLSPQRLNHPVHECDRISRSNITVLVRDITPERVILERIWF